MSELKSSILAAGGVAKASAACGVSRRAIYKWIAADALPRTEYTSETSYAQKLADAADGAFTAEWLLSVSSPKKAVA